MGGQMGTRMSLHQLLSFDSLPEPYSDTVPYVPEFCAFLPKSVGYVDINGPLNPEAGRECRNHLVQHLTVQMGSPGSEKESAWSLFLSNLVAVSGQAPDSCEPFHMISLVMATH